MIFQIQAFYYYWISYAINSLLELIYGKGSFLDLQKVNLLPAFVQCPRFQWLHFKLCAEVLFFLPVLWSRGLLRPDHDLPAVPSAQSELRPLLLPCRGPLARRQFLSEREIQFIFFFQQSVRRVANIIGYRFIPSDTFPVIHGNFVSFLFCGAITIFVSRKATCNCCS